MRRDITNMQRETDDETESATFRDATVFFVVPPILRRAHLQCALDRHPRERPGDKLYAPEVNNVQTLQLSPLSRNETQHEYIPMLELQKCILPNLRSPGTFLFKTLLSNMRRGE